MLKTLSLILSLTVFLAAIWIIIPAPAYFIWLFSVAASEWSLWIAALALTAIIFSVCIPISGGDGKLWIVSLIVSSVALVISLYPFFSIRHLANEQNVSLSIGEYFSGSRNDDSSDRDFTTRIFVEIDGKDVQLDVYSPTVLNENKGAAVVVIHGGSWNAGSRNDFPQWNRWLAANGFTVFDIDYRLAPQPNYLSSTGDVKCAVRWIKKHSSEFEISPDRIALFGRSAGAHLALLAAYSADDSRLPPGCLQDEQDGQIRAVVSFYAPVDLIWDYDNPANRFVINGPKTLADFLGGNPHESNELRERFILASPTAHVSAKTPPTLLVHGGRDQLVRSENMQILDEKLNEANVPHKTLFIPYAQHGFDYDSHGWGAQIVKPAMLEFLRENTRANNTLKRLE
ncbi:MAG: alpha/beta hydrolase [Pyrinomonadaceae bacterium]